MSDEIFQTAPDIAYGIILQKILDGEYAPGTKLSLRKMAQATNVSVIPVMEALNRLEESGLVESKPQWGSFVSVLTKEKVIQTVQLREAVECQVARIMAQQITKQQADTLMEIATDLDTVPYDNTSADMSLNNHLRFHQGLAMYTGNELLVKTLERANLFWILAQALVANASNAEYPRYWHRKLMDDILSGDPDRAEKSMREHVLDSLHPILDELDRKK